MPTTTLAAPTRARRDRRFVAQAARDLDPRSIADRLTMARITRRGPERHRGPVEVDDVKPPCSPIDEPPGNRRRIRREGRLASEVALLQANDAPASEVDRRKHDEVACHCHATMLAF